MKEIVKRLIRSLGYEIRAIKNHSEHGSIRDVDLFLLDTQARGFCPQGIIDVGANYGNWSSMALSIFPGIPLLAIEPQVEMISHLQALVDKNPQVRLIQAGAAKISGELVQTIWEDLSGSSFLPTTDERDLATGKQRKTPTISIDELLSETYPQFQPDLVKLDIQGFELEALAGAETLFGKTEVFIIETSLFAFFSNQPISREVINFMADRSYELYDITEYLRRPFDLALGQVDLVFVKRDGMFRSNLKW